MFAIRGSAVPSRVVMALAAGVLVVVGTAGTAMAAPVTFTLNYQTVSGAGTAAGTFTVDDSLLVPDMTAEGVGYLLCATITVTVPGIPVQTYHRWNFNDFYFTTDASGEIIDVNFFMNENNCPGGFRINGTEEFELTFYQCPNTEVSVFHASPTEGGVCEAVEAPRIPTSSPLGLAVLVLLLAAVALVVLRRGTLA